MFKYTKLRIYARHKRSTGGKLFAALVTKATNVEAATHPYESKRTRRENVNRHFTEDEANEGQCTRADRCSVTPRTSKHGNGRRAGKKAEQVKHLHTAAGAHMGSTTWENSLEQPR